MASLVRGLGTLLGTQGFGHCWPGLQPLSAAAGFGESTLVVLQSSCVPASIKITLVGTRVMDRITPVANFPLVQLTQVGVGDG